MQTPMRVIAFGKIILAFLSDTILKLFFFVPSYFFAKSVSPEIAF